MRDITGRKAADHRLVSGTFRRRTAYAAFVATGTLGALAGLGAALAPWTAAAISDAAVPIPRVASCTPPTRESVSAESVLKNMRDGIDVDVRGRVIEGSLEADPMGPPGDDRKTSLRVITGKVHIESCKVTGRFAFPRCVFAQGLDLPCTEIRGDLDLSDTHVKGSLNAARSRVLGEIRASHLDVSGDVSFADGIVGERIDVTSVRIDGSVDFTGAMLSRDIEISKSIVGGIELSYARVAGLTKLDDVLVLGDAAAHDARFGRGLQVDSLRTVGSLDLDGAGGTGEIFLRESVVGRDLLLSLAARGPVIVSAVVVGRELSLMDGQFAALTIAELRVGNGVELEGVRVTGPFFIRESDFGKTFSATDASFEGISEFTKVRFPGEDPLAGAIFRRAPLLVDTVLPHPPAIESLKESPEELLDDDDGAPPD